MRRTLLLICTLLCANVLLAQTTFTIGDLTYGVISTNPPQVEVHDANLSITTANIPETVTYNETTYSVTSIEEWAFCNCSSLTSVTIANSVISIGNNAFYNCRSLTYISIGNSLTYIGYDAFYNCSSLNTLNFNAINCNDFYNLSPFFDCPITTINIGDSVQRIPNHFAKELSSLTSVNIGNNVTSIGNEAFEGCSSLQNVTCLATTPPTLADNTVFPNPNTATLTVPCGTLEAYSSATSYWNMFFMGRISEDGYEVVANVNNDAFGSVAIENNCSTATLTATANEGYVFLSWNDGNTENPRVVSLTSDTSFVANFIVSTINTEITATICQGQTYTENGFNVSEAGVYTQTLTAINGADSVVTLTLNVNPIFNTELSATICEGQVYTENNFNVSEAGVYTQTLTAVNGCDSIVTLTLNVNPIFNTELTATICEGQVYTENNFNVSEAGVYTQTLTSVNGCDSIVTLTLNILPSYNTNLTATICQGSELNISGFNVTEGGVYTQNLTSVNGCDSIVTLTVTELPTVHTDLTLTICEGTSLNFSGFNVSEAGVYTQTHTSVNGCDSIVTLTVSVNPTFDTTINATINAGETYAEFGFNESEAGTYVQNLQTVNGCDSTITLILDVNSSLIDVEHSELSFYPNPTDSEITFSQAIEKVEVIDQTGRCVLTFSNAREINIESLYAGAYYLRLTNKDKAIIRKVIKG